MFSAVRALRLQDPEKTFILLDRIANVLFFVMALLVMRESLMLSFGEFFNPGPGFVPFFVGLSIALLSILGFLLPDRQAAKWFEWNGGAGERTIFYVLGGLIIYLLLLWALGFFIDTFLLLVYLIRLSGEKVYKKNLVISVLTVVTLYLVFYKFFKIPFPVGALGM